MEWLQKLLDYGTLGIACLAEGYAILRLYLRNQDLQKELQALEQKRADENKNRLDQVLAAMGESRSRTGYSMQTRTSRTRE